MTCGRGGGEGVTEDLCYLPAMELGRGYRRRELKPTAVVESVLERIDALTPTINALVTIDPEAVRAAAAEADRAIEDGGSLGPLHGVPVSIKDLTPVKGLRTTYGSKQFEHHVADEDALVVERLRKAGAIILGKTNTPEFGYGGHTFNKVFGVTRNPWNPRMSAGGSTGGGGAAVAAGMGPIAEGSDLGGSLRTPAAFNGIAGLRASPGCVPSYPKVLAFDTLSVSGVMGRTVADVALAMSAIAGPDARAPSSYPLEPASFLRALDRPSLDGLKVAWTPDLNGLVPVDAEVVEAFEKGVAAFERERAKVTRASPDFSGLREAVLATRGLSMVANHADRLGEWRDQMQDGLVWNIEYGLDLKARDIARGEVLRAELFHRVRRFFEFFDLLLLPSQAVLPFPVDQNSPAEVGGKPIEHPIDWFLLPYAVSLVGSPAMSVPCGFSRDRLPVGMQIVAPWRQDAAVIRAAAAFERAAPWNEHVPPTVQQLYG